MISALVLLTACGAPARQASAPEANRTTNVADAGEKMAPQNQPISQRFRSLDQYLAHLELTQAPVDGPWYREVKPGIYELQTGNLRVLEGTSEPKRIFTREELEREFGFRK
jgi:hypothetical protein